jgi:hypothetical protein
LFEQATRELETIEARIKDRKATLDEQDIPQPVLFDLCAVRAEYRRL